MSVASVEQRVQARLQQDLRGDRGWFIITRVHVEAFWLKGFADYLHSKAGNQSMRLDKRDYKNLATLAGVESDDPGIQLRRHHLLVMYKPLRLIERLTPNSWGLIQLTKWGMEVAQRGFFSPVLDAALFHIRFAREPAIPGDRVQAYSQFDVRVYLILTRIMRECDGYIDRDEFDYFVSRVRAFQEVFWAIDGIRDYRATMASLALGAQEQLKKTLSSHVRRGLSNKEYQNWRDVGLHTFSLFGVGAKMLRDGRKLWLTSEWARSSENVVPQKEDIRKGRGRGEVGEPAPARQTLEQRLLLKVPIPPKDDELLVPPIPPALNSGAEAENLIAKILTAEGWRVVFYSSKRGFGFDLWAGNGDVAMVVEVKSSVDMVSDIVLTANEFEAARHYGKNYVIAVVERAHDESPQVWFVSDPANTLQIRESTQIYYRISHADWRGVAARVF